MILCCMMLHVELVGFAFGARKLIPRIQKDCLSWHVSGTEDRCVTKRKRIHWGMFQVLLRGVLQWQLVGLPSQAVHCPWTPHHSCFWQGKIPSWEQVSKKYVKHVVTFLHLILLLSDQCVFQGLDLQHYDLLHLPKIWVGSWRCSTVVHILGLCWRLPDRWTFTEQTSGWWKGPEVQPTGSHWDPCALDGMVQTGTCSK